MEISVVIPTYNRVRVLERTLRALAIQAEAGAFEVIVVDDGSSDATPDLVARLQHDFPVPLDYFYQPNRKQGAARNLGVHHARGEQIVFLGDDIVPEVDFLARHREAHRAAARDLPPERIVTIGYTTWPAGMRKTRFLEFIGEQGWQFGYSLISDPMNLPFNFFYTSNLMMNRRFFLESDGFDEDFREYGWEDIELSLRLKSRGMILIYARAARAAHHHELDMTRFVARQRKVGRSAWELYRKHPELASFLGIDNGPRYTRTQELRLRLATIFCRFTEKFDRLDMTRCYGDLMTYHYVKGLEESRPEWFDASRTADGAARE